MDNRATLPTERSDGELISEIEQLFAAPLEIYKAESAKSRFDGVLIGQLVGFLETFIPLVVFPGQPGTVALSARTTIDLRDEHIGDDVVLIFEESDPRRPLVVGKVRNPKAWPLADESAQVEVDADGQRLVVNAKEQIVFKCGKASITLTAAGKVLIRGEYISSQAAGINRLKGGSVQLN